MVLVLLWARVRTVITIIVLAVIAADPGSWTPLITLAICVALQMAWTEGALAAMARRRGIEL